MCGCVHIKFRKLLIWHLLGIIDIDMPHTPQKNRIVRSVGAIAEFTGVNLLKLALSLTMKQ